MAERLRSGLQIRVGQFDSGSGLQPSQALSRTAAALVCRRFAIFVLRMVLACCFFALIDALRSSTRSSLAIGINVEHGKVAHAVATGHCDLFAGPSEGKPACDEVTAQVVECLIDINATHVNFDGDIQVSGNKVVGARQTGWGTPSGTLSRTPLATGASHNTDDVIQVLNALTTDLRAHGLIGN